MLDIQVEMNMGAELFDVPRKRVEPQTSTLKLLVEEYNNRYLQIPLFQRSHVWSDERKKGWAKAIKMGTTIPVFFLYSIQNQNIYWLADGCQRLYTTLEILRDPDKYGFLSAEEVNLYISRDYISISRMSCDSHEDGYKVFVDLNAKGTAATAAEVYKGLLVGNDQHSRTTQLYNEIVPLVRERLSLIKKTRTRPTSKEINVEIRSNLGLFLQYASETKKLPSWNIANNDAFDDKPVERDLAVFLENKSSTDIDLLLSNFLNFVSQSVMLIKSFIDKHHDGKQGGAITNGLARHLLHFCIYCRNTGYLTKYKAAYIEAVINNSLNGTTKIIFQEKNGDIKFEVTASTATLSCTPAICKEIGIPWGVKLKRNAPQRYLNGLDNSHYDPFSTEGNGDVFPEPASLNRARGAEPVPRDGIS